MATLVPRTVLITGCSSGIGLAVAVRLAQDPQQRFHGKERGRDPSMLSREGTHGPMSATARRGREPFGMGPQAGEGAAFGVPVHPAPEPFSPQPPGLEVPWLQARSPPCLSEPRCPCAPHPLPCQAEGSWGRGAAPWGHRWHEQRTAVSAHACNRVWRHAPTPVDAHACGPLTPSSFLCHPLSYTRICVPTTPLPHHQPCTRAGD